MIKLSKAAKKVMDKLVEGLKEPGDHKEVDNSDGFMSVHVEHIGTCNLGEMFSVAHYYSQNGDLMKDPDMVFIRADGDYFAIEFQQDPLIYQRAIEWVDGKAKHVYPKIQKDMTRFANQWMKNIRQQQKL